MTKLKLVTLGMIIALLGAVSCKKGGSGSKAPDNPKLKTKMDSVSYALGYALSGILKSEVGITDSSGVDFEIMKIAMQRSVAGDSLVMDEMKVRMILQVLQNEQMVKREADMKKQEAETLKKNAPIIANNEKLGTEFLTKNKTVAGVVTTASGLQYKIIKAGTGAKPTAEQKVKVHYTGKLLDGTIFDSSIGKDPVVFKTNEMIPGWVEVLQLMPVGSKWEVYIPSEMAYGKRGGGNTIPGGSTLIFELELLSIEK